MTTLHHLGRTCGRPKNLRLLLQSQGHLKNLAASRREFVCGRTGLGEWRNESPGGGLTELYVYHDGSAGDGTQLPLSLGLFVQLDQRFTLPGHVGLSKEAEVAFGEAYTAEEREAAAKAENRSHRSDLLARPTNRENQSQVLYTAHDFIHHTPDSEQFVCSGMLPSFPVLRGMHNLSCEMHEAPLLLRKELKALFPGRDVEQGNLSLITIAQRTQSDMSAWSEDMEEEREKLTEQFFTAAKEICARLQDEGHWADFVDPCSGTPYYGGHVNTTMFETDEKYRLLGFRVEDLGCCKVISHRDYGRNVFVGTIFSDAPVGNGVIEDIFQDLKLILDNKAGGAGGDQLTTPV